MRKVKSNPVDSPTDEVTALMVYPPPEALLVKVALFIIKPSTYETFGVQYIKRHFLLIFKWTDYRML